MCMPFLTRDATQSAVFLWYVVRRLCVRPSVTLVV